MTSGLGDEWTCQNGENPNGNKHANGTKIRWANEEDSIFQWESSLVAEIPR